MDPEFLQILVCPACKGKLEYQPEKRRLVCRAERLAYPIAENGVPALLAEETLPLGEDE
ncbi:MAG: Trm112 family protein [Betaproteobacteria bacterium]|nr:Trm112 family protein [Betaproteobacteria bacterium]